MTEDKISQSERLIRIFARLAPFTIERERIGHGMFTGNLLVDFGWNSIQHACVAPVQRMSIVDLRPLRQKGFVQGRTLVLPGGENQRDPTRMTMDVKDPTSRKIERHWQEHEELMRKAAPIVQSAETIMSYSGRTVTDALTRAFQALTDGSHVVACYTAIGGIAHDPAEQSWELRTLLQAEKFGGEHWDWTVFPVLFAKPRNAL